MRRFVLAAAAALACLAAPATAAAPVTGTIIFRNYSGTEVAVGNLGVDNTIVMAPFRGRATFRGADRLTTYIFAFDATGDNVSDNEIAVNLEGTRRIKVSVGDLGILGLIN